MESCSIAQAAGADRIELCDNQETGGTTPSLGFIKAARKILQIPLFPIIRPRNGDFLYTTAEFECMKTDILLCKNSGCDGVVFGILYADGTVDKERCAALVSIAYPMEVTFHRAFDRTNDPFAAMQHIIHIGCQRILTSGQQPTAIEGINVVAKLMEEAKGRIVIMPGSGIRSNNISMLLQKTNADEIHSSATKLAKSKMMYCNPALKDNATYAIADHHEIAAMKTILNNFQHSGD